MSKFNKVKNLKNMVSSLDINKLYQLQEYVSVSQVFFKNLDLLVNDYICDDENGAEYIFTNNVIDLYKSMKDKLNLK